MDNKDLKKQELTRFVKDIAEIWDDSRIPYPVHFCGGNEEQLIGIFEEVKKGDWIFSNHRSQYHYLLAGGSPEKLEEKILNGKSMHVFDKEINFFTSSILSGGCCIAAGVAYSLKKEGSENKVWCFVGDGAEDEGHFYEAVRYVDGWQLPCTFIIEDNNRSVETPKTERYGKSEINWPGCVRRYDYTSTYPHAGTGKHVDFSGIKIETTM
mgnify:CR=1 FL=1